jgi:hypothetical protein
MAGPVVTLPKLNHGGFRKFGFHAEHGNSFPLLVTPSLTDCHPLYRDVAVLTVVTCQNAFGSSDSSDSHLVKVFDQQPFIRDWKILFDSDSSRFRR